MVQMRIMDRDAERVGRVLAELLPVLRAHPGLQVGDPVELGMRGEGRRVVLDLTPAPTPADQEEARERFLAVARAYAEEWGPTFLEAFPPPASNG